MPFMLRHRFRNLPASFLRGMLPGLSLVAALLSGSASPAAEKTQITIRGGLLGCVKVGRWAPIRVEVDAEGVKSITVEAVDPHGNAVRFPLEKRPAGNVAAAASGGVEAGSFRHVARFEGLFQAGRLDTVPAVIVEFDDGRIERRRLRTAGSETERPELVGPLRQSVILVATLGRPAGFKSLGKTGSQGKRKSARNAAREEIDRVRLLEYDDAGQLPSDVRGFDALDVMVISGEYRLDASQDAALRQWVREGGHLVVCRGSRLQAFETPAKGPRPSSGDGLLAGWLPVTIQGQDWLRDLSGLESFAGRKSPIFFGGQIRAARIEDPQARADQAGIVLARSRNGPLIVRVACGFGQVTFCGLDFHAPPVSTWDEVNALGEKILEQTVATIRSREVGGRAQLSQSGVSDLGTQLHSIVENFPSVRRMTAFRTIGLLIVYIVLIGPLDFLLVHRVLNRPRLTWITFPLLVIAATWLSIRSAGERNGQELRLNQFELLDVDATQSQPAATAADRQSVHGFTWFTAYSSDSMHYDLQVRPAPFAEADKAKVKESRPAARPALCWSGVNETVYGGMYRRSGLAIGQLDYTVRTADGAIDSLPIPIWSTKTFKAEWREPVSRLIESRLSLAEGGRLTGTFKHRFAAPIEDWILAFRGKLYWFAGPKSDPAAAAIPPNVDYQVSTATVQQSGLMDHLTGVRFRQERADEDRLRTTRFEQDPYDSNGKDPLKLLRTLTFYQAIGGRKYTGLSNANLERLDLSRLLVLNRAVLVGRIRGPAARIALSPEGAGKPRHVTPNRSDTFVRVLLPVRRGKRAMTNDETQMTKEFRMTNDERPRTASSFGFRHSFDIRHSTFDIPWRPLRD
jgi:hypothetical protein